MSQIKKVLENLEKAKDDTEKLRIADSLLDLKQLPEGTFRDVYLLFQIANYFGSDVCKRETLGKLLVFFGAPRNWSVLLGTFKNESSSLNFVEFMYSNYGESWFPTHKGSPIIELNEILFNLRQVLEYFKLPDSRQKVINLAKEKFQPIKDYKKIYQEFREANEKKKRPNESKEVTEPKKMRLITKEDAEDEKKEKEEDPNCIVCLERKKCAMILPCQHTQLCATCALGIGKKCPVCKCDIEKIIKAL